MKLKINNFFKCGLVVAALMLIGNYAQAQRVIKGKVTDAETGEALIGANVVAKGTTSGSSTDVEGMYSVNVPAGATMIEISYAGYTAQAIALGVSNTVDIALAPGKVLDQAVVIGYGSVKKSDATGAVSVIGAKDFNKGVISSPEQLMQGRVAGVQVSQNSGEPGGGINVRIRGTSSMRNGNNPLFVIDGVPLSGNSDDPASNAEGFGRIADRNPLTFINPDDIESISILKDASATAIYGSRGANGVVLITTKKGKEGKGTVDYSYSLGASSITKKYDLLDAASFAAASPKQDKKGSTDWQKEIFQTGLANTHSLSFGGGVGSGNYRFSLGYLNQTGIIKDSGLKRYTARFSSEQKMLNDRLTLSTSFTVANTEDKTSPISENAGFVGDLLSAVLKSNPTLPAYLAKKGSVVTAADSLDKTGAKVLTQPGETEPTPLAILKYYKGTASTLRGFGNITSAIKIMDGLTFKTVLGFDRTFASRTEVFSGDLLMQSVTGVGRLYSSARNNNNKMIENYLTYDKKFGNIGFSGLLGYSYQNFSNVGRNTNATAFSSTNLDIMANNSSAATKSVTNSFNSYDELQSYFGRVNLNISEKYLLTASLRRDGSTKFGPNNKYGNFPSFAAKWRVKQESFCPKFFSDLGLRVGYGVTGNQEIPHNVYDQRNRISDKFYDSGGNLSGGSISAISNNYPDLKWEQTAATNFGLDFGFANNRISGSVEVYNKNTTGLLLRVRTAQPAATEFNWTNLPANVINKGVELTLNLVPVAKKDFSWNVNFNVAMNDNTVKNFKGLINTGEISGQGLTGAFAERIAEGQPLYAFFLRPFGGYDDKGNSIYPQGDVQQFLGGKSPLAKVTGGLTNTFSYKGLDLNIFFNGVFGNYIYSNTANAFFTKGSLSNGRNVTKDVVTSTEGAFNAPDVSTRFLQSGSFVRLGNLSLAYNFKPGVAGISNVRVFVAGQNLATFTQYTGQDPEVNTNKQIDGVPSAGIDYNAYPRAKTVSVGANVSF